VRTPLVVLVEEESREIGGQATAVRAGTGSSNPPCSSEESVANSINQPTRTEWLNWHRPARPLLIAHVHRVESDYHFVSIHTAHLEKRFALLSTKLQKHFREFEAATSLDLVPIRRFIRGKKGVDVV
jgi:hypothetical protein